jgi:alcohol dehydrogenase (cytochrome c)
MTGMIGIPPSRRVRLLATLLALIVSPLSVESYAQDGGQSESKSVEVPDTGEQKGANERPPITFTSAQASAGRTAYAEHCALCHGEDMEGFGLAPSLIGSRFNQTWRGKSAGILAYHLRRMPPEDGDDPVRLSDKTHTDILAHILSSNDFTAGDVGLPSDLETLGEVIIPPLDGVDYDPDAPVDPSPGQVELLESLPAVTDEMLNNPPPGDWLLWGRTRDMQNFSPLKEINKENVSQLKPVWRVPLRDGWSNPAPLVHQGVMFLQTFPDKVLALDASNGMVLWRYQHEGDFRSAPKMGIALHGDKVLVPTSDLHVVALNAKTGEVIWGHAIVHDDPALKLRSAPLVAGSKVIQGVTAIRVPKGGFIVALDIDTGAESWRFNTVGRPGELGGDTWNDLPLEERSGGSVWHQGSYDAELNLVYFGTAPTYDTGPLLHPIDKEGVTNDALFTNTTLALNPDTGDLVWHYQHLANDQWDLDWAFERQIIELPFKGAMRTVVLTVGKMAILDALDAATGEYLFSMDMGLQNIVASIDPLTGEKVINPETMPDLTEQRYIAPNHFGARCWPPLSYNPQTKHLYLPLAEGSVMAGPEGGYTIFSSNVMLDDRPIRGSDGKMGRLQALNLEDQSFAWQYRQAAPLISSLTATASGLLFAGDLNRSLMAFDDATGDVLWQTELDDVPGSNITIYSVDGKQYVTVVVGLTNYFSRDWSYLYHRFAESFDNPVNDSPRGGAAIWTFALGGMGL